MARVVVFGTGDIARLALYYFSHDSDHEVVAFTVDEEYLDGSEFEGRPLVGFRSIVGRYPPGENAAFVALSYARMNQVRAEKFAAMREAGYKLLSYVSSRCSYLTEHAVGANCFILEDNTIQPFARIGDDVTLWSGNHIGHHSRIDDHCFITSHVVVSGNCRIGRYCFIGVNATLRNGLAIGEATLVGAGATIMHDTEERSVYVPPRAVRLERRSDEVTL